MNDEQMQRQLNNPNFYNYPPEPIQDNQGTVNNPMLDSKNKKEQEMVKFQNPQNQMSNPPAPYPQNPQQPQLPYLHPQSQIPQYPYNMQIPFQQQQFQYQGPTDPQTNESELLFCPNCQRYQKTRVNHVVGPGTVTMCACLAFFGLYCCCCLIPCLMNQCKDTEHYCPICSSKLGKVRFLFQ